MSDAITVSAPISGTDRTLTFEAGQAGPAGRRRRAGPDRRHRAPGHGDRRPVRPGGGRLLPADRGHRGAGLRRREDPRLVLPPGGQVLGPGHPDLPPHRPAPATVVPQGLPQRGPRRRHHLRRRPGQPPRRAGHQRRLGGPHALGDPLRRTDRRGAGGLFHRRTLDSAPHLRRGRRVDLRAGGGRPGPERRRRCRDRHHDGRGRAAPSARSSTTRRALPRSPRRSSPTGSRRPRPGSASRSCSSAGWSRPTWPPGDPSSRSSTRPSPTTATTCGSGWRPWAPTRWPRPTLIVSKAERNAALDEATADHRVSPGREFPDREGEIKAAVRGLTKKLVRKRIVEEGVRIDGRTTSEIRPLSAEVDLFPTAHGSALFQRGETQVLNVTTLGHAADEPAARHHHARRAQALHAPLQLPAVLHRRDRLHAGPEAPGDRARPAGRAGAAAGGPLRGGLPLHPPPGVGRAGLQRLHVDGVGVRLDPVDDGRRCAAQGAGGGDRHGPRLRRTGPTSP